MSRHTTRYKVHVTVEAWKFRNVSVNIKYRQCKIKSCTVTINGQVSALHAHGRDQQQGAYKLTYGALDQSLNSFPDTRNNNNLHAASRQKCHARYSNSPY